MISLAAQYVITNSGRPLKRAVITTDDDGTIINIEDTAGSLTEKHSTEFSRLERKKEALVKSLFSKRKIDVATASAWLEISQSDFLKKFPKTAISAEMQKALIESYQKSSDEDLTIAKDFEQVDKDLDQKCDL